MDAETISAGTTNFSNGVVVVRRESGAKGTSILEACIVGGSSVTSNGADSVVVLCLRKVLQRGGDAVRTAQVIVAGEVLGL